MSVEIPLRCRCGALRGVARDVTPETGNRLVCHCDDCQAFAHFLEQGDVLDAYGGTDIFQLTPAQLRLDEGREQIRCMRLSERGLLRWYTACCRTPIGNTLASARVAFVGVVHRFMDHGATGRSRDDVLGPPRAFIHGRFALGGCPPHAHRGAPLRLVVRSVRLLARGWRAGAHAPSPFFDAQTKRPIVRASVLAPAERERLRRRVAAGLPGGGEPDTLPTGRDDQ